jgi:hypothetical protein
VNVVGALALVLTLMLGVGAGWAVQGQGQEPGPGEKTGGKLDEAGRSIKKGLQEVGETIRGQYAKARESVHNMGVASRVYGRLHWDKALHSSTLDIDVKNGIATLRGSVPDSKARLKAVDLAADTVGITKVVDQLTILPPSRTVPATSAETEPKP